MPWIYSQYYLHWTLGNLLNTFLHWLISKVQNQKFTPIKMKSKLRKKSSWTNEAKDELGISHNWQTEEGG